ncbi:hypothetical protein [Sansalvadorimonas verongulae]|uniref:hypothetical protein n=1 Tax=Sansalvadorimonas verongulae TaxID=2172824 RepID=UPI0012BB99FF|nr:hypothetical protein [Sansalvadorimonas verongulae]MTI12103.1 hypothetical protein [Sansalvadorimonas verongulae]
MTQHLSAAQRLELCQVSEREIQRYAGDHAMWHKHVHNVELDAMRVLKMIEMDEQDNTIDFSCRRTGKTAVKEMWIQEYMATHSDQELGVVAPREAQSITNLTYHTDAIRRSAILENFLLYKGGRKQMADASYQFSNRSKAGAFGIMAQVDDEPSADPVMADMQLLCRQLVNIKSVPTKGAYASYKMVKRQVGDDLFDAFMAMVWAFVTRGECHVQTIIASRKQTRAQLLGQSPFGTLGNL